MKPFGYSGKAIYPFTEGDKTEAELFYHEGNGCINHMWFGGNWDNYGKLRLRVYVDGEDVASIDTELFLWHGIGYQDAFGPWGTKRIGKTGHPSGLYNTYRIPFGQSIRVTAQLAAGDQENRRFWYIIRGVEDLPISFGDIKLPNHARMRLHTLEDYTAKTLEEFSVLEVEQAGMLYQVTVAAHSESFTFLESCVRAYVNGQDEPLLLSSGLEDYFLGTYYFNKGMYHNEVAGLTHLNEADHSFAAYRFHEEDPIVFDDGLRLTLRCGEETELETWDAPTTTYTTCVWTYEW